MIPTAYTPSEWEVSKVGRVKIPSTGDEVDLMRLTFSDLTGIKVLFMTAPDAIAFADLLREQTSGLTIAHTFDERNHP